MFAKGAVQELLGPSIIHTVLGLGAPQLSEMFGPLRDARMQ